VDLTYEVIEGAPPAWSWDRYETYLVAEWATLLERSPAEDDVQRFLELHPCMVPGGEGGSDSIGGHNGTYPRGLVAQPELSGIKRPIPDFLWVSHTSAEVRPVLLEIEAPAERWFTKQGVQTAQLSQAIQQLASWRAWFDGEANRLLFFERYHIGSFLMRHRKFAPVFCLIYGRRSEFDADPTLARQRANLRPHWLEWMTYDRLRPLAGSQLEVSVKVAADGWHVVAIPPTFRWGAITARNVPSLHGWETAISNNELISEQRRQFLLDRLSYWRSWAENNPRGSYGNHWE
jgi:hypothetical protein